MVSGAFTKGLLLLGLLSGLSIGQDEKPLYKDASASVEDRVSDLLGRMTIEDKMAQLIQGAIGMLTSC
jgi:beta-glucosidase